VSSEATTGFSVGCKGFIEFVSRCWKFGTGGVLSNGSLRNPPLQLCALGN
jgi:hypothetical protein